MFPPFIVLLDLSQLCESASGTSMNGYQWTGEHQQEQKDQNLTGVAKTWEHLMGFWRWSHFAIVSELGP